MSTPTFSIRLYILAILKTSNISKILRKEQPQILEENMSAF